MMMPEGASALEGAVGWAKALLLGSAGVTIAVLAVAAMGVLMLQGRMPVRRGTSVVLGCFILFSAGQISSGLVAGSTSSVESAMTLPAQIAAPSYTPEIPAPAPYDPYAGAALPGRGRMSTEQPILQ
jgi:type IV secretory pathway VirB2 component (pilin)